MDAELKSKWLAGMRSGDYLQGRGQLKCRDNYCCLGVLAVVAGWEISDDGNSILVDGENVAYKPFDEMFGSDMVCNLYELNDSAKNSLPQIADYVDANITAT